MRSLISLIRWTVIMLAAASSSAATINSVSSGNWTNPATWGGIVPTSNDTVKITRHSVTNKGGAPKAHNLWVGANGKGEYKTSSGNNLTVGLDFLAGGTVASTGTVNQTGATTTVGRSTRIGAATNSVGIFNLSGGTFNGKDTSVGQYGIGTVYLSKTGTLNTTNLWIGDQPQSMGVVDLVGGNLNAEVITLGRCPSSYGELNIATTGIVKSAGWRVGTNGVGYVHITGSRAAITFSNSASVIFGSNATFKVTPDTNGITKVSTANGNIVLDGNLIVNNPGVSFPSSMVLLETLGSGVITGTFANVTWNGLTNMKLIYTNTQVRVEKGEEIVDVSGDPLQEVYFGIDAERLTFWKPAWSNEQAQALTAISNHHVRVAINCAYEREEGIKNPAAYTNDKIFAMMSSLTNLNPDIKFFASPRPLFVAYSPAETASIWGGICPWSPYPAWILQFEPVIGQDGTTNNWIPVYLDEAKLTQYFADYLNLMHSYGYNIAYLDLINENDFVTPSNGAYVVSNLPSLLNPGVPMPQIVAPSSWSLTEATQWIDDAPSAFFQYAGVHNSGGDKSLSAMYDFTSAALSRNVDAWNTELHDWIGPGLVSEITTSSVLWDHFRGGFSSVETWLFFGNYEETTECSMCLAGSWYEGVRTNGKYSIFKKLANEAGGGCYMLAYEPLGLKTAAFKRNTTMTVWVLNSETETKTTDIKVPSNISGSVEVSWWHTGLSTNPAVYADISTLTPGNTNRFAYSFQGESLYCFKMNLQ